MKKVKLAKWCWEKTHVSRCYQIFSIVTQMSTVHLSNVLLSDQELMARHKLLRLLYTHNKI